MGGVPGSREWVGVTPPSLHESGHSRAGTDRRHMHGRQHDKRQKEGSWGDAGRLQKGVITTYGKDWWIWPELTFYRDTSAPGSFHTPWGRALGKKATVAYQLLLRFS